MPAACWSVWNALRAGMNSRDPCVPLRVGRKKLTPPQADLVRGLPKTEGWGRWAGGTVHPTVCRPPSSGRPQSRGRYSFGLMVRTHGRSPTSSIPLCFLFSDALDRRQGGYLNSLRRGDWEGGAGRYLAQFNKFGIRPDVMLRLPSRRLHVGPHVQKRLVGLTAD